MSEVSEPDLYSKPLDFARPICGTVNPLVDCAVPLEDEAVSCNANNLNASVSPVTNPTSGEPKTFFTFTKFWISNLVLKLLSVSKSLALFTSINFVPTFSNS